MILSKKYSEIMKNIEVSDEMRSRILGNISKMDIATGTATNTAKKENKKNNVIYLSARLKKYAIAACLALVMLAAVIIPNIVRNNGTDYDRELITDAKTSESTETIAEVETTEKNTEITSARETEATTELTTEAATVKTTAISEITTEATTEATTGATIAETTAETTEETTEETTTEKPDENQGDIPPDESGLYDCKTLNDLIDSVGFRVRGISALPFFAQKTEYMREGEKTAVIKYTGDGCTAIFKKSPNMLAEEYLYNDFVDADQDGKYIMICGTGKRYNVAYWHNDKYYFSLYLSNTYNKKTMLSIISSAR